MRAFFKELLRPGLFPIALIIATTILLGASLPGHYKLVYALQDSGHFLIFTLLSLAALWPYRNRDESPIWQVILICLLFGASIEGVQSQINRDPSLYDLLMDMLGSVVGVVLYLGFIRRSLTSLLSVTIAIGLALVAFSQPLYWLMVYQVRADEFPRLINPDNPITNGLLGPYQGGELQRIELPDSWSIPRELGIHSCVYVSLLGGRWPGIDLQEPEPDWQGYDRLELAIYSDQESDLPLTLRIRDQMHNYRVENQFNRGLTLHPGYNRFSIPLVQISKAPRARNMNLSEVSGVKIFTGKDHEGSGFCLLSMRLG